MVNGGTTADRRESCCDREPTRTRMNHLSIRTTSRLQMCDITNQVQDVVRHSRVSDGLCVVYCPHTTAGITVNENADPDVSRDLMASLARQVPATGGYAHVEGNSDAHVKASLVGPSLTLIVESGRIRLGTWQGIFLCEWDGPRNRKVWAQWLGQ